MSSSTDSPRTSLRPLVIGLACVFAVWFLSGLLLYQHEHRGTFGDMFGAVNALFSGMAFAALIYTVLLQRRELELQRLELQDTRKELEGQKLQLAAQNDVLRLQTFESSFFQTLSLLNSIVGALELRDGYTTPRTGRECFRALFHEYHSLAVARINQDDQLRKEAYAAAYLEFHGTHGHLLGHYFRTLYNLIKLVHRSAVADKRFYANLVRAQLSDPELSLLFYNCLSELGSETFRPLVEEYALLKNLRDASLLNPRHVNFYGPGAYGAA